MDDPLLRLQLHASTIDLLRALLGALEEMSDGTAPALTADQRSYSAVSVPAAWRSHPDSESRRRSA
jgi:hypothetical protein